LLALQYSELKASTASSLEQCELERSHLEDVVKRLRDELADSDRQLMMLERELQQRNEQLTQSTAQLVSSRDDCVAKSEQVFISMPSVLLCLQCL